MSAGGGHEKTRHARGTTGFQIQVGRRGRPPDYFFFAAFLAGAFLAGAFLAFGAAFLAAVFLGADLGDFLAMMM